MCKIDFTFRGRPEMGREGGVDFYTVWLFLYSWILIFEKIFSFLRIFVAIFDQDGYFYTVWRFLYRGGKNFKIRDRC